MPVLMLMKQTQDYIQLGVFVNIKYTGNASTTFVLTFTSTTKREGK